ncbi:MAG TPA: hypothetical protein PLX97_11715 [Gemmatales bacterium]|nr:hypothetical protein [Gemmatales bacterium]
MHPSILLYLGLSLAWLVMAILIYLGFHERFLGKAEPWKQYLAMGLCLLMILWNFVRIHRLRLRQKQQSSAQPTENSDTL